MARSRSLERDRLRLRRGGRKDAQMVCVLGHHDIATRRLRGFAVKDDWLVIARCVNRDLAGCVPQVALVQGELGAVTQERAGCPQQATATCGDDAHVERAISQVTALEWIKACARILAIADEHEPRLRAYTVDRDT